MLVTNSTNVVNILIFNSFVKLTWRFQLCYILSIPPPGIDTAPVPLVEARPTFTAAHVQRFDRTSDLNVIR